MRAPATGIGIAASDASRIFNEFERAAGSDIPRSGLGLGIDKELCRVLKAQLQFRSLEGQGTTFEVVPCPPGAKLVLVTWARI